MPAEEYSLLRGEIERRFVIFRRWSKFYSSFHHGFLFAAAVCSGLNFFVLVPDLLKTWAHRSDASAALSFFSTMFVILAIIGSFERKWRVNHRASMSLEKLLVDLTDPNANLVDIRRRLKAIIRAQDDGIVGPS